MSLGPVMLDIAGTALDDDDRRLLGEPAVGGVILFARNYAGTQQLRELTGEIRSLRTPPLLIAVDQEGGRVQRFREEFTPLPAAHLIGRQWDLDHARALTLAEASGFVMASELRACGVDLSFAPVLDLARGISEVIGDRAFHRDAHAVGELGAAQLRGMRAAGMEAVGKHFPGHGGVTADSHLTLPVDRRFRDEIDEDIEPFARLIRAGIPGIMTAHVVYVDVDRHPASFSRRWIADVLRERLRFTGAVVSDDLSMAGAAVVGDIVQRGQRALAAGCDLLLVCNDRRAARELVRALRGHDDPVGQVRLARMHGERKAEHRRLRRSAPWQQAVAALRELSDQPPLDLQA